MTEDAISRKETREACQMFREYESNRTNSEWVDRIETVVKALPPKSQEPRTGHWIYCYGIKGKDNVEMCSHCQSHWKEAVIYSSDTQEYLRLRLKYCPNCGYCMERGE